jgi:hypothetical protein
VILKNNFDCDFIVDIMHDEAALNQCIFLVLESPAKASMTLDSPFKGEYIACLYENSMFLPGRGKYFKVVYARKTDQN